MIPVYHAAGQLAYSKATRLYLQQMNNIHNILSEEDYIKFTQNGCFTVRRKDRYFSGNFTDLTVEQDLMKEFKVAGGMTRGITDSTLAKFFYSLPFIIPISKALKAFCGVHTSTSDQHRDLSTGNMKRDCEDYKTFLSWLESHSPLSYNNEDCANKVVCIANGVIAPKSVNCDESHSVGLAAAEAVSNSTFADAAFKRNNKVNTIYTERNSTIVRGQKVAVNETVLFMKVAAMVKKPEDLEKCMKHEFNKQPPSLFKDGEMRAPTRKSDLAAELKRGVSKIEVIPEDSIYVVDGGYYLHRVDWSNKETYQEVIDAYVEYADLHYSGEHRTIVFDGYQNQLSTKLGTQRQRALKSNSAEIIIQSTMKVTEKREDFLGNRKNKTRLISILTKLLEHKGFIVEQHNSVADPLMVSSL